MHVPDELKIGQAWDDDLHGTQRVITGFLDGDRVAYRVEVRHRWRGVEWVCRACLVSTFWAHIT